jgi:SAM-dependent methyltransferase
MINEEEYDEEYFERGLSSGKSGYQDYRWLPERTIKFAHKIIKEIGLRDGDRILDYGCAKGFLVKAFRILDIDAYGCDISKYALANVDLETRDFCKLIENEKLPYTNKFHWIIAKDVYEHLTENELENVLEECSKHSDNLFSIVPLGDGEKYIIPSYQLDITHKLAKPREWWEKKFEKKGWNLDRFSYLIKGMKDNWSHYEKGNGFFFLKRKEIIKRNNKKGVNI